MIKNWSKYGISVPAGRGGHYKTFCPKCHDSRHNKQDIPVMLCESAEEAVRLLADAGKTLYTAAAEGDADLWDLPLGRNAAVVIGNEGAGASEEFKTSSRLLRIPMAGGTESLNAAAAGAVIMYESLRQKGRK